jgi:hypothetical protein
MIPESISGDLPEDPSVLSIVEVAPEFIAEWRPAEKPEAESFTAEEELTAIVELARRLPCGALQEEEAVARDPYLWLYRDRTLGMLRRYLRLSVEVGRLPSLLGREFFRTRVTSYSSATFEDLVIFVHDVEQTLSRLYEFDKRLIATTVFQDYTRKEAGALLGCTERTVQRRFYEVVDLISEMFLRGGLLDYLEVAEEDEGEDLEEVVENGLGCDERTRPEKEACGKSCQEGEEGDFHVSVC